MSRPPKQVVVFFLVAYALSWFGLLGNWIWSSDAWPVPILPLGPIIAAPLVVWWYGGRSAVRACAQRMKRLAAPPWVYATALLLPLGLILASIGFALSLGIPSGPLPTCGLATLLIGIPLVTLDGPAPEEPAFRGFG